MSVPEEVRRVPRPRNTVVLDTGSKGPTRYAVRARAKSVYIKGHNPQPRNGKTVGHIINMKFVPVAQSNHLSTEPQLLSYGSSALAFRVGGSAAGLAQHLSPGRCLPHHGDCLD